MAPLAFLLAGCFDLDPAPRGVTKNLPGTEVLPTTPTPTEKELVPATSETVGTKGKDYGGGIITEPIRQRFRLEDRIILLQVQNAMNLYNAEHGKYPASHEEFMKNIVQANGIKLPPLPPGQQYIYDVESHTLMVERPKQ
jgi:hypothetical protein